MNNDREFQTAVLAALLHDIGKFAQRTGRHSGRSHPELSSWFVSENLGKEWADVVTGVGYHHLPAALSAQNQRLTLTLVLADWLSSGERRPLPEGETGGPADDALISIFSQLRDGSPATRYPLCALPEDGKLEPGSGIVSGRANYQSLWDSFTDECRAVRRDDFQALMDQLLALLEKYTVFVPSAAWKSETDISLYHHLKSTAAIASCLHLDGLDAADLNFLLNDFETSERTIAWLVGGDVSGIQGFIYNLTSKGALKALRGRSLYLQLLPEAIAGRILDEFGLTRANIVYCGGGHFYMLVPATPDAGAKLSAVAADVDEALLEVHRGRLSVALAMQELRTRDFLRVSFGSAWDTLHNRLGREKKRRFHGLFAAASVDRVLGPHGKGGEPSACTVCGEEAAERDTEDRCPMCASFADLSADLTRATVLIESRVDRATGEPRGWRDVITALGREYWFEPAAGHRGSVFALNTTDFVARGFDGFRFLAKHVPQVNGRTAELSDIAEQANGLKRWGVLRVDVDDLGETFKTGLGKDRSFSRLSMLSYLLSYFFSARIQAITQEDDYKDRIYLAYSGGDDLFAIGPWSALPDFARRIRDEFRSFTSDQLTLSAGIFVAPSEKFPVYEAADKAGKAEDAAKSRHAAKDRVSFLGSVVTWAELAEARKVRERLIGLIESGLPRSILGFLGSSLSQQQEARDGKIPMYPVWRLLYAFKRLKSRSRGEIAGGIEELEHQVVVGNGLHPQLDLIIRWAEFEITTNKESQ